MAWTFGISKAEVVAASEASGIHQLSFVAFWFYLHSNAQSILQTLLSDNPCFNKKKSLFLARNMELVSKLIESSGAKFLSYHLQTLFILDFFPFLSPCPFLSIYPVRRDKVCCTAALISSLLFGNPIFCAFENRDYATGGSLLLLHFLSNKIGRFICLSFHMRWLSL